MKEIKKRPEKNDREEAKNNEKESEKGHDKTGNEVAKKNGKKKDKGKGNDDKTRNLLEKVSKVKNSNQYKLI